MVLGHAGDPLLCLSKGLVATHSDGSRLLLGNDSQPSQAGLVSADSHGCDAPCRG